MRAPAFSTGADPEERVPRRIHAFSRHGRNFFPALHITETTKFTVAGRTSFGSGDALWQDICFPSLRKKQRRRECHGVKCISVLLLTFVFTSLPKNEPAKTGLRFSLIRVSAAAGPFLLLLPETAGLITFSALPATAPQGILVL
ncbi:MAG: hypothetical protein ABUS49_10420 [Acidobacteriota bacterium]